MKTHFASLALLSILSLLSACNQQANNEITPETQAISTVAMTGTTIAVPIGIDTNLVRIARRLTNALNAGSESDSRNAFADNATFDSVGRIYTGSNDIMSRFLTPEVIRARGVYREERIMADSASPNLVTIQYDFRTPSYQERFTYRYEIRNGVIQNVIGRYL